jgi:hypothetical protein
MWRPFCLFFDSLREALVVGRDPKHRLLGFLVLHFIGKSASLQRVCASARDRQRGRAQNFLQAAAAARSRFVC